MVIMMIGLDRFFIVSIFFCFTVHKLFGLLALAVTSGTYEVFLKRSGRKIWVKPEPRAEP